jgi:hypothetical protein
MGHRSEAMMWKEIPERLPHRLLRWLVTAAMIALIAIDAQYTYGMSLAFSLIGAASAVLPLWPAVRLAVRLFSQLAQDPNPGWRNGVATVLPLNGRWLRILVGTPGVLMLAGLT